MERACGTLRLMYMADILGLYTWRTYSADILGLYTWLQTVQYKCRARLSAPLVYGAAWLLSEIQAAIRCDKHI